MKYRGSLLPQDSYALQTVAVYLPGTAARVLVTQLEGPPADALADARGIVLELARVAPERWHTKVVALQDTTDLIPTTPTLESGV